MAYYVHEFENGNNDSQHSDSTASMYPDPPSLETSYPQGLPYFVSLPQYEEVYGIDLAREPTPEAVGTLSDHASTVPNTATPASSSAVLGQAQPVQMPVQVQDPYYYLDWTLLQLRGGVFIGPGNVEWARPVGGNLWKNKGSDKLTKYPKIYKCVGCDLVYQDPSSVKRHYDVWH
ncbi:MAG: hypothetical protein MMC23_005393 [Stictis urceolatum]|nr:hypothetical protein [Stictis urceolata]